jgi:formylglycine-generating enzyme required for sulfatase activity
VCAAGCEFTTIQAALDDPETDRGSIIEVRDPVRTEAGIVVRKDVTIRGQGAIETIVQAHKSLDESHDRVFFVEEGTTATIRDMTVRHGNAPMDENWRYGGGIANRGNLTLENCTITQNVGNNGGGIWSKGALRMFNCTVSRNLADRVATQDDIPVAGVSAQACGSGGGIKLVKGATLTLVNSTVSENEAMSHGGGVFVACETWARLSNCTVSGNRATTWGGGICVKDEAHLTHCTVVGNSAKAKCASNQMAQRCPKDEGGGGVYVRGTLHFTNTIIANNGREDCARAPAGTYGVLESGKIGTNSNNLVRDGSCGAAFSGDPLLERVEGPGGEPLTYALLPGSPAIDAISAISCALPIDQRGQPRPIALTSAETPCDIGAIEAQLATPAAAAPGGVLGETWTRPADGMAMVYVPAGEFVRGSDGEAVDYARELCMEYSDLGLAVCRYDSYEDERPAHQVWVEGFWIDRTEVTNGQYGRCVEAGNCEPPEDSGSFTRDTYFGNSAFDDYPVIWVTWQQASDYCSWTGGRLPTEAEWEFAARGPESRVYPWGDDFDGTRLNYCDRSCAGGPKDESMDDGYAETAPVGSFPQGASWCGALDMAGNVREWVAGWYGEYPLERQVNPAGPATGNARVPRGGCWLDRPDNVRSANRGGVALDYTRHKVGFRCALDAPPVTE